MNFIDQRGVVFTIRTRWKSASSLSQWRNMVIIHSASYIHEGIMKGKEKSVYLASARFIPLVGSLHVLSISFHFSLLHYQENACSSDKSHRWQPPFFPTSLTSVPTTADSVLQNKVLIVKLINRYGRILSCVSHARLWFEARKNLYIMSDEQCGSYTLNSRLMN